MPGVLVQSGQYNTSPCPWGSTNCTSGPGSSFEGTSDANGQIVLNIPYTCPGEWSCNFYADGFDLYPFDQRTGYISGDVQYSVVMVANETTGGGQPPANNPQGNPNEGSAWSQLAAGLEGGNPQGKTLVDWLSTYWWLIVLAVLLAVVLILALRHRTGAIQAPNLTAAPTLAVA